MATAKKSSTKKSSSKKKTVAAKATAKKTVAAKKAISKQAVTPKTQPKSMVTLEKLKKFNLFAAGVNTIFAVLSAVFLTSKSAAFYLPYSTKDELASLDATVLGPAYEVVVNIELRYILAFIFGLSAIFSVLLASRLRSKYEAGVSDNSPVLRWVFLGITSALFLEFASVVGGVADVLVLKMIALLVLVTALLAWFSELQNKAAGKNFGLFYISLLTGALAWLPLVVGLIGTSLYGMQAFDWYVYALAAVLFIGFGNMVNTHYRHIKNGANREQYLQLEGKYVSANFLVHVAAFVVVFVGLYN